MESGRATSRRVVLLSTLVPGAPAVEISSLASSTEHVHPGSLFFCVPGFRVDGHDFAAEAVRRGAAVVVCERRVEVAVPSVVVSDVRAVMGTIAARFFGDPSHGLPVIGVTGTNGKTTVAALVRSILERAGVPTGLLGTVEAVIGGTSTPAQRTTPEAIEVHAALRRMVAAGDRAGVMEVSSHGLALHRVKGVRFACRVFTNLSHDHLDFHGSMERYFEAKRRLFAGPGTAVVGVCDPYGRRLASEVPGSVTYALHGTADYLAEDLTLTRAGACFRCRTRHGAFPVRTRLLGEFNVANTLAAIAATETLGMVRNVILQGLQAAEPVRGRLQVVDEGQPFLVVVDYAHNPAALENALRAVRALVNGEVHVVFGAPGDRDRAKRPEMGAVASLLADRVTVTSDDPHSENPAAIADEVVSGARPGVERELDRRAAIARAVRRAAPGDAVLVAGRGHEDVQEFADGAVPFNDAVVAREELRAARRSPSGDRAASS